MNLRYAIERDHNASVGGIQQPSRVFVHEVGPVSPGAWSHRTDIHRATHFTFGEAQKCVREHADTWSGCRIVEVPR